MPVDRRLRFLESGDRFQRGIKREKLLTFNWSKSKISGFSGSFLEASKDPGSNNKKFLNFKWPVDQRLRFVESLDRFQRGIKILEVIKKNIELGSVCQRFLETLDRFQKVIKILEVIKKFTEIQLMCKSKIKFSGVSDRFQRVIKIWQVLKKFTELQMACRSKIKISRIFWAFSRYLERF